MELRNINENVLTTQVVEHNENEQAKSKSSFIGGRTQRAHLDHLKNDCVIPVFSKDNETTISHFQFIQKTKEVAQDLFPSYEINEPDIRVSHQIKGRVPSAIGKPVKELLPSEKTIYYERCAFMYELKSQRVEVDGNPLILSLGGVRAYNQENLYSKKSLEKFKLFIGFQNKVCLNLCVSSDGFTNDVRVSSVNELESAVGELFHQYNEEEHLESLEGFSQLSITENQFAHLVGRARMYQHLSKTERNGIFPVLLNDGQINQSVKDYYNSSDFKRANDGSISLWNLYNLFTSAGKTSYIDSFLERNVNAYQLVKHLGNSIKNDQYSWFLHN